jgi:hypothetical protein
MRYDVREHGAMGNGAADDTVAIQRAIDVCSRHGGGTVLLHDGVFPSGTIHLRSHVELHLTSTAVLRGTPDLSRYHVDPHVPYKQLDRSLIYALDCDNIAITGQGTVDGQGASFPAGPQDKRPVGVRLRRCRNVRLEGVRFLNAGAFMIHPIHCSGMRIEGIRIDSLVRPNNDGIDLDGCQDVFISRCNITSSDDAIALKVIEAGQPTRDVVISDCILRSLCAAIRVGPDAVEDIERVTVSNCVIRDTGLNGIKIQEAMGTVMRDMVFSNIVMDNVAGPISLRLAGWKLGDTNEWAVFDDSSWEKGALRNILFQNIRARGMAAEARLGISITGTPRTPVQGITFSNIDITFPGGGTREEGARRDVPDLERTYPECYIFGVLPAYGLYVHHAEGITLHNVRFSLASDDQRPALVCDDARDVQVVGLQAQACGGESVVRLQEVRGARIWCSRVEGGADAFLQVEGAASSGIVLADNATGPVKQALQLARGASPGAARQG